LRFDNVPSGWSDASTERFSGWDIIPTQVPILTHFKPGGAVAAHLPLSPLKGG